MYEGKNLVKGGDSLEQNLIFLNGLVSATERFSPESYLTVRDLRFLLKIVLSTEKCVEKNLLETIFFSRLKNPGSYSETELLKEFQGIVNEKC